MSTATLTSPPTATARLVVDTDVASFVFKWHPEFAPRYVSIMRGAELVVSFMTLAHLRQFAAEDLCNSLILLARAVSDAKM